MSDLIDLKAFADKKKNQKIVSDINDILKILSLSQKGLSQFKHYAPVQEIISVIETNKTLFEVHRKRYAEGIV